jgi:putative Ca2+/H+ antiporter (TMEM165/GDT1 family)
VESLGPSFLVVLLAEMGDKTQLLAFALAARFRKPWPIMAGILAATLLNHGISAWVGGMLAERLTPAVLNAALAISFFGFGIWTLIPDKDEGLAETKGWGPFVTTLWMFFLAEVGDKTQLATMALGARFASFLWVTAGTTAGMLAADGLAVFAGGRLSGKVPFKILRYVTSGLFFGFSALAAWKLMRP